MSFRLDNTPEIMNHRRRLNLDITEIKQKLHIFSSSLGKLARFDNNTNNNVAADFTKLTTVVRINSITHSYT